MTVTALKREKGEVFSSNKDNVCFNMFIQDCLHAHGRQ